MSGLTLNRSPAIGFRATSDHCGSCSQTVSKIRVHMSLCNDLWLNREKTGAIVISLRKHVQRPFVLFPSYRRTTRNRGDFFFFFLSSTNRILTTPISDDRVGLGELTPLLHFISSPSFCTGYGNKSLLKFIFLMFNANIL